MTIILDNYPPFHPPGVVATPWSATGSGGVALAALSYTACQNKYSRCRSNQNMIYFGETLLTKQGSSGKPCANTSRKCSLEAPVCIRSVLFWSQAWSKTYGYSDFLAWRLNPYRKNTTVSWGHCCEIRNKLTKGTSTSFGAFSAPNSGARRLSNSQTHSGKCKVLIFLQVWSFYSHALYMLSADDSGRFLQYHRVVAQIVCGQDVQSMRVKRSDLQKD